MARVRTNIEIDADAIDVVMARYGLPTKTAAVDLALRHLAGQPMTRDEALGMRGAHAIGELSGDVPPQGVPPEAAPPEGASPRTAGEHPVPPLPSSRRDPR